MTKCMSEKKLVPRSAKKFKLSMEKRITLYLIIQIFISVSIPRLYLSIYQDLSWRIKFSLLRDISEKRSLYRREGVGNRTWQSSLNPLLLSPPLHSILFFYINILLVCSIVSNKRQKVEPSGPTFFCGNLQGLREDLWLIKILKISLQKNWISIKF